MDDARESRKGMEKHSRDRCKLTSVSEGSQEETPTTDSSPVENPKVRKNVVGLRGFKKRLRGLDREPEVVAYWRSEIVRLCDERYLSRRDAIVLSLVACGFSNVQVSDIIGADAGSISGSLSRLRRSILEGTMTAEGIEKKRREAEEWPIGHPKIPVSKELETVVPEAIRLHGAIDPEWTAQLKTRARNAVEKIISQVSLRTLEKYRDSIPRVEVEDVGDLLDLSKAVETLQRANREGAATHMMGTMPEPGEKRRVEFEVRMVREWEPPTEEPEI